MARGGQAPVDPPRRAPGSSAAQTSRQLAKSYRLQEAIRSRVSDSDQLHTADTYTRNLPDCVVQLDT